MKTKLNLIVLFLFTAAFILSSCKEQPLYLEEGKWKGIFYTQGSEIPFNFSVEDDTIGTINVFLTNAEEKTILDSVRYERDSVIIPIEVYDAILVAKINSEGLSGYFRKNQSTKQGIPFQAVKGNAPRFDLQNQDISASVDGKWSVNLVNDKDELRYTVGLLKQKGNIVTGTILTTTGDYRYLEGVMDGDSLKLSGFSGSNPSLLVAKLQDSVHLSGAFISPGGKVRLEALRND